MAKEIASPRELEATLLLKAAARLQAVIESWDKDKAGLTDALLYNRKLWTVFLGSAMSADNPLPTEIRQNVANLGMYIMSQTIAVSANPRIEVISSLVTINRELAAGLRARAGA